VLQEYFGEVISSDVHDYGYAAVADFLAEPSKRRVSAHSGADWIITNPPFKLAESFLEVALARSRIGVALLTRTVFIESIGRYERLFRHNRPTWFAQFTERVPMIKGRLDRKASTATGYAWLVWLRGKQPSTTTELVWIPPCRKLLERDHDYDTPNPLTAPGKQRRRARSQTDLFAA